MSWGHYREYIPVGRRQANAKRTAAAIAKKAGRKPQPVQIQGRKIARTFWGKAWCDNLEQYSDFENRLPRGRTYARNGSLVDLMIGTAKIDAIVAGSDTYVVEINIKSLKAAAWKRIKTDCAESIDSLMDLLAGRFSDGVMERLTRQDDGLFPKPSEIHMECSCPDWADVCKHIAATFYGVAVQLDDHPELLFRLRDVDHNELVTEAVAEGNLDSALGGPSEELAGEDLGAMFGIELDAPVASAAKKPAKKRARTSSKNVVKKAAAKKASKKKAAKKEAVKKKAVKKKAAKKSPTKKKAAKKKAAKTSSTKKAASQRPRQKKAKKVARKRVKKTKS